MIHLRNLHPKQIVYVPIAPGWKRILRPAVTTSLPRHVLHTPAVRRLLISELITIVDGGAWDPDTRQARAAKADMARAIAAAEQREFDRLLEGQQISRAPRRQRPPRPPSPRPRGRPPSWTAEQIGLIQRRLAEGASRKAIAAELGLGYAVVSAKLYRLAKAGRGGPAEAAGAGAGQRVHKDSGQGREAVSQAP